MSLARTLTSAAVAIYVSGCLTHSTQGAEESVPTTKSPEPPTQIGVSERPLELWTPDRVRNFILNVEKHVDQVGRNVLPYEKYKEPRRLIGECYGRPAYGWVEGSQVLPTLRKYLTGTALGCYVATYFGCTLGDRISHVGMAAEGAPDMKPFTRSKVTVLEQTPTRVVADVVEADNVEVDDKGVLRGTEDNNYHQYSDAELDAFRQKSRYTLSRDAAGVWRLSDRVPTWQWECRPR